MVVSARLPQSREFDSHIRPVNLRTDLAPLADLIELVFSDTMDSSGRAALREMRLLSRVGAGLNIVSRMNDLTMGINMGYVWVEDDRLVGNVSIYPANWPEDLGTAWIIANVGVHPDYQRRGIATRLMLASMEAIHNRGARAAVLQVDYANRQARELYRKLGFIEERAWTVWRRSPAARTALPPQIDEVYISRRRRHEWRSEYELAQRVRPPELGGLGWLRPLHPRFFRGTFFHWFNDLVNLRRLERLVIRSEGDREILASLWIESGFGTSSRLTLMVDPNYQQIYDEALISTASRRFGDSTLIIEHPHDDAMVNSILSRYRFIPQRSVVHMRWDVRR
jgi:GNAT superfamily N-acetyltransferase